MLKNYIPTLILLFSFSSLFCQTENISSGKYHLAKKVFEDDYEIMSFHKFSKSEIQVEDSIVYFNNIKSIEFDKNLDSKYQLIIKSGLLDPFQINNSISLKINSMNELTLLNPNSKTKRFSFWVYPNKNIYKNASKIEILLASRMNPDEYYFELQNENANENTTFEEFIKEAKLTFLKFGTIIL